MIEYLLLPLYGYINRIRGGGYWAKKIPGRPLFWVLPVILATAIAAKGLIVGSIFTAIYGIWAGPAWGRWYTFGRIMPVDDPNLFEKIVEFLPGLVLKKTSYWFNAISFSIRNILTLLPVLGLYFLGVNLAILIAAILGIGIGVVVLYDIAWKIFDRNKSLFSIEVAEISVGVMWAAVLLIGSTLI